MRIDKGLRSWNLRIAALAVLLCAASACARSNEDGAAASTTAAPAPAATRDAAEPTPQAELEEDPAAVAARHALIAVSVPRLTRGAVLAGGGALSASGSVDDVTQPLPAAVREAFAAVRSDPDPDALVRDAHYWVSNEWAHYVFEPHIRDLGGVLVGVGTDQVYLYAGWAKSTIVVPLDFDRAITRLHMAYGVLFEKAETPEAFRALWAQDREAEVIGWLEERFGGDPAEAKAVIKAFKGGREAVAYRLRKFAKKYEEMGVPTFVTDAEQYAHVRTLWLNGRVFPVCGDLTADTAMVDVAEAARRSDLDIRLLYLSNAEVYFEYGPSFRRNIVVQPFSEKSMIMRTRQLGLYGLPEENDYHYNLQPGRNFAGWMAGFRGDKVGRIFDKRRSSGTQGLSIIDEPPIFNKTPPTLAALPEGFEMPEWAQAPQGEGE